MSPLKRFVRDVGLKILRACGSEIVDAETGQPLGRAFLFAWRGTVHLIGFEGVVRPVFLPQARITYWQQQLGFTTYPAPDFPRRGQGS